MKWMVGIVITLIVAIGVISVAVYNNTRVEKDCTISEKEQTVEVTSSGSGEDQTTTSEVVYYVYTEQCGALQIRDQLLFGQFSSAELYGSLKIGRTYHLELIGMRIPVLGWFPTILRVI